MPPSDSAYYKAIQAAEEEVRVTAPFLNGSADTHPSLVDDKLDFLQPTDEPGRLGKLGTFGVLRIVGRGGMGVVLHAYDPCLDRDVAIKVIDPQARPQRSRPPAVLPRGPRRGRRHAR